MAKSPAESPLGASLVTVAPAPTTKVEPATVTTTSRVPSLVTVLVTVTDPGPVSPEHAGVYSTVYLEGGLKHEGMLTGISAGVAPSTRMES